MRQPTQDQEKTAPQARAQMERYGPGKLEDRRAAEETYRRASQWRFWF